MAKKVPMKKRPVSSMTTTLPSADNAKWLAFGFIASVVLVSIFFVMILGIRG